MFPSVSATSLPVPFYNESAPSTPSAPEKDPNIILYSTINKLNIENKELSETVVSQLQTIIDIQKKNLQLMEEAKELRDKNQDLMQEVLNLNNNFTKIVSDLNARQLVTEAKIKKYEDIVIVAVAITALSATVSLVASTCGFGKLFDAVKYMMPKQVGNEILKCTIRP